MPQALQIAAILILPALVAVAALRDLTSFTIPNWISLAILAGFAPAALVCGLDLMTVAVCVAVGLGALVVGMGLFAAGWIGGGDAKLFAASALWLGWPASLEFLAYVGLAGGLLAFSLISLRSAWVRPYLPLSPRWFCRLVEPEGSVPYGVAIAVGALAAYPASPIMQVVGGL